MCLLNDIAKSNNRRLLQKMDTAVNYESKLQLVDDKISYIRNELARILKIRNKDEKFQSLKEIIVNLRNMDLEDLKVVVPSPEEYGNNTTDIRKMVAAIQEQLVEISSYVASNRQMMEELKEKNTEFATDIDAMKQTLFDIEKQLNEKLLTETIPDATKQLLLENEIRGIKNEQANIEQQLQEQKQQYATIRGYQQQVQDHLPYYSAEQQPKIQELQEQYHQQKQKLAENMRSTYKNLEEANQVIESLQRELEDLRQRCRIDNDKQRLEYNRRYQDIVVSLTNSENQRRQAEAELANARVAINSLRAERNTLINQISSVKGAYENKINELAISLNTVSNSLKQTSSVSNIRYTGLRKALYERDILKSKLNLVAAKLTEYDRRNRDAAATTVRLNTEVFSYKNDKQALEQKLNNARMLLAKEYEKVDNMRKTIDDFAASNITDGTQAPSAMVISENGAILREILNKLKRLDDVERRLIASGTSSSQVDYSKWFEDVIRKIQDLKDAQMVEATPKAPMPIQATKDYTFMLNDIMRKIQSLESSVDKPTVSDPRLQEILAKMNEMDGLRKQIASLEEQLRNTDRQMTSSLQGELKNLQMSKDSMSAELNKAMEKQRQIEGDMGKLQTELMNKNSEITELKKQLSDKEVSEFDDRDEIINLKNQLKGKEIEINTNVQQLKTSLDRIQELEKMIRETSDKNSKERNKLMEEKNELTNKIKELEDKLLSTEDVEVNLKKMDLERAEKIKYLESQVVKRDQEIESLKSQLENSQQSNSSNAKLSEETAKELQEKITKLEQEKADIRQNMEDNLTKNMTDVDKMKELQNIIDGLNNDIAEKTRQNESLNKEGIELVQKNGMVVEENKNLSYQVKNLTEQIEKLYSSIEELENKNTDTASSNVENQAEIDKLNIQLADMKELQTKFDNNQREMEELQKRLGDMEQLRMDYDSIKKKLGDVENEKEALQKLYENDSNSDDERISMLNTTIDELQKKLGDMNQQISTMKTNEDYNALENKLEAMNNLMKQMEDMTQERDSLKQELEQARLNLSLMEPKTPETDYSEEATKNQELQEQIEELENRLADKDKSWEEYKTSFEKRIQALIETRGQQSEELQQELDEVEQEFEEYKREKETELETMAGEIHLRNEITIPNLNEQIMKLTKSLLTTTDEKKTLDDKFLAAASELIEVRAVNANLDEKLMNITMELNSQKEINKELSANTDIADRLRQVEETMGAQLTELKQQLETLSVDKSQVVQELETAKLQLGDMEKLRSQLNDKDQEIMELNERLSEMNNNINEKDTQIAVLNGQIETMKNEIATLGNEKQQLQTDIAKLQESNTNLQNQVQNLEESVKVSGDMAKQELASVKNSYDMFIENAKKLLQDNTDQTSIDEGVDNRQVLIDLLEKFDRLSNSVALASSGRIVTLQDIKAGFQPEPKNDAENINQRQLQMETFRNWWATMSYYYGLIKQIFLEAPTMYRLRQQLGKVTAFWDQQQLQEIKPLELNANKGANRIDSNAIVITDSTNKVPSKEDFAGINSLSDRTGINTLFVRSFYCAFDTKAVSMANNAVTGDKDYERELLPLFNKGIPLDTFRIYDAEALQEVIRNLCVKGIEKSQAIDISQPNTLRQVQTIAILLDIFVKFVFQSHSAMQNVKAKFGGLILTPETRDTAIVSYMKIRIDNRNLDQRYKYSIKDNSVSLEFDPKVYSDRKYSYNAVYSPYSNVFDYNLTNDDIGRNMTEVIEKLNGKKNVLIMALGPSGAGKTATLIGRRDIATGEWINGCLPSMLNQLSNEVNSITLTGKEILNNYQGEEPYYKIENVYNNPVSIVRNSSGWGLQGSSVVRASSYTVLDENNKQVPSGVCEMPNPAKMEEERKLDDMESIGSILADMVERRLNCGTSNNPDSSRSHLVLIMKLNTGATLVVADLAGREKKFMCADTNVLKLIAENRWYPSLNEKVKKTGIKPNVKARGEDDYYELISKLNSGPVVNAVLGTDRKKYDNAEAYASNIIKNKNMLEEQMKDSLDKVQEITTDDVNLFFEVAERLQRAHLINQKWITSGFSVRTTESFQSKVPELKKLYAFAEMKVSAYAQARDICGIRSNEGSFINKSLDDFEKAIKYVISSSKETREAAPLVNDICFPINCAFADTTCFTNTQTSTTKMSTAIGTIFENATGNGNFFDGLTVCPFLVVDFTSKPTIRIYTPYEDQLREILAHIDQAISENSIIRNMKIQTEEKFSTEPIKTFVAKNVLTGGVSNLTEIIQATAKDFANRTNENASRVYSELDRQYGSALETVAQTIELDTLEGVQKYKIHKMATMSNLELLGIRDMYEEALKDVSAENGNTAPGIMWNVDNMMKYYLTGRKRCVIGM